MSRTSYPLLDIKHALEDADRNLSDVVFYVETLQREGVPDSPPDAALDLVRAALAAAERR